eukprot:1177196-Prorocentrum_minimum.AAC.1
MRPPKCTNAPSAQEPAPSDDESTPSAHEINPVPPLPIPPLLKNSHPPMMNPNPRITRVGFITGCTYQVPGGGGPLGVTLVGVHLVKQLQLPTPTAIHKYTN